MLVPRPYQLEGRDFLASKQIGLLADEMRVGKTGTAILAAQKVGGHRSIVLCQAIAVPMWLARWQEWAPDSPLPAVYSFEKGLMLREQILAERYDVAIVDECQFAGNPEAKRTAMIYGKGGLAWQSGHLWALSGTPAPKHAGSLWPILTAAGVVTMSYDAFLRRYCRIDYLSTRPVGTKEEMIPELRALWQQIGLRRTRKDVAPDMPAISFDFLQFEPMQGGPDLDSDDIDFNPDFRREDRVQVALAKVGSLVEEVGHALSNGLLKQTVIFGWHLEALRKVVSCLRAMGFSAELLAGETPPGKRAQIEQDFAAGTLGVVVGQIRACGTSIDLSAASHGYFLELDWVPGNNVQAANRLVSMMKADKVTMDVCTWPGSTDDRVQKVLLRRARELAKLF